MPTPTSTPESHGAAPSTRDRILDAAAAIMRRDGLVRATTKEIAREAGCSAGATIVREPTDILAWRHRALFFRDPEDNLIEIYAEY